MQSLFIVSLPRSLSSLTFRQCRDALGLEAPSWAIAGEILNHDLHRLGRWPEVEHEGSKYLTEAADPARFRRATDFLEVVAKPSGCIYKDVVNPFVVTAWSRTPEFRILKIHRDVAEVAHSMLSRGWAYPANAAPASASPRARSGRAIAQHTLWRTIARRALRTRTYGRATASLLRDDMLRGLLRAERAIDALPGVTIGHADLASDEGALQAALQRLYPEVRIPEIAYIDADFRAVRERTAEGRRSAGFERIRARVDSLRKSLAVAQSGDAIPGTFG